MTLCRCGADASAICSLCKSELCSFHQSTKTESTPFAVGVTKLKKVPVCFPNCTSSFGAQDEREVSINSPVARA